MKRSIELSLVSIILLIAFALLVLKDAAPSESIMENVTSNLAPFDYFYLSRLEITGNWSYKIDSFRYGDANLYYDPSYDSSSWSRVDVPFMFKATHSNYSMWIRVSFEIPENMRGQKLRLVFPGVWGVGKVWLNKVYLGGHYGYFSPFFFDIDDVVDLNGVNVLTLYVETPVQDYYESRTYPVGPYSFSEIFPTLDYNLIGIWRSVMLVGTRDATVNLVLVDVKQYSNPASLSFRTLVQNKGNADERFSIIIRIKQGTVNKVILQQSFSVKLSTRERRWSTFDISLPDPEFWYPWDSGVPNIYFVNISIYQDSTYGGSIETVFGIRPLEGGFSSSET
ncbi:MAG: sugar-binding domain-containing protein [Thermoproteota archaeon]